MNRRDALRLLRSGLVVSAASSILPLKAFGAKRDTRPAALLLPLSGERAALGLSMQRAAMLAQSDAKLLVAFDTAGTATGAAAAAQAALKRKCAIILGPLTSWEASAAAKAVAGRVPVVAFTNNPAAAAADGAFVFGLTAQQATTSVLGYARSRGVRNVVVVGDGSVWSNAASEAAVKAQGSIGLDIRAVTVTPGGTLPAAGEQPDAVLLPGSGEAVLAAARNLRGSGIQLLGTVQALDYRPSALEALDGAWLAAPDPKAFGDFATDFQGRNGGDPGTLAALAYDASRLVNVLRDGNRISREGLIAGDGFTCVTGTVRFRSDGSCARDLSILVANRDGYASVATSRGA